MYLIDFEIFWWLQAYRNSNCSKKACAMYVPRLKNMFSIYFWLTYFHRLAWKRARWKGFYLCNFAKHVLTFYQLCIKEQHQPYESATRNIKFLFWFGCLSNKLFYFGYNPMVSVEKIQWSPCSWKPLKWPSMWLF